MSANWEKISTFSPGCFLGEQLVELGELLVLVGLPRRGQCEDRKQPFRVGLAQVLAEFLHEQVGTQPLELVPKLGRKRVVAERADLSELRQGSGGNIGGLGPASFPLPKSPESPSVSSLRVSNREESWVPMGSGERNSRA